MFRVEVLDGDEWIPSVREDLYEGDNSEVLEQPAEFATHGEAEAHIDAIRGLMHCGGGGTEFRIAEVQYLVMCRVSGGVTGTRQAPLKGKDGTVQTFDTYDAAQAKAKALNVPMPYAVADFRYWVIEASEVGL